jgi:hypothetical protein
LSPIDAIAGITGLILPKLPERFATADPPATVNSLGDRRCDPLGGHQKRR